MNIVLITVTYPPEVRAISVMLQELAGELLRLGHEVTVVTCRPTMHVAEGVDAAAIPGVRNENGVRVIRIPNLPGYKRSFIIRGLAQAVMPGRFLRAIRRYVRQRIDWVIVYSPPLPLALAGARLKETAGCRFMLNIQDIFPQNAVDLGILKNRLLIRYFEKMETSAYAASDSMTSHTESSMRFLIERKGVPREKISYIPNWVDIQAYAAERARDFRSEFGLKDTLVFLFSGVMGPSQDLDFILDLAVRVRDCRQVRFLLVGDGSEKQRLARRVRDERIENVQFRPYVPAQEYPALVSSVCDAGLVCLSMKNRTPVIPGKILGFMAAGKPVLALVHRESDVHQLIRAAGCGFSGLSDSLDRAEELIRKMWAQRNSFGDMGLRGREYAFAHFSKTAVMKQLVQLLE